MHEFPAPEDGTVAPRSRPSPEPGFVSGPGAPSLLSIPGAAPVEPPNTAYALRWVVNNERQKKMRAVSEQEYDDVKIEHAESAIEVRKTLELASPSDHKSVLAIEGETMRIYSPYLLEIIPEVVGYYPSYSIRGHKDPARGPKPYIELSRPYRMLNGVRENLTSVKKGFQDVVMGAIDGSQAEPDARAQATLEHIEALEHELDKIAPEIEEERLRHKLPTPMATFDMLWLLFRPGRMVLTKVSLEWAVVKVYHLRANPDRKDSSPFLKLMAWYPDFDGKRRQHDIQIDRFTNARPINELPAYPVECGCPATLERLLNRGKQYFELLAEQAPQRKYDGMIVTRDDEIMSEHQRHKNDHDFALLSTAVNPSAAIVGVPKKAYRGSVVVDPFLFSTEFGEIADSVWLQDHDMETGLHGEDTLKTTSKIDPRSKETRSKLSGDFYMMLPRWIRGFAIDKRLWATFDVSCVHGYEQNRSVLKSLVIDEHKLNMIKAITEPRLKQEKSQDVPFYWYTFNVEQVEGKGEGRVILLHGPPGTGKTFTAEYIAEYTKRPLLRMTCGELGLNPSRIEAKLWQWFRMAEAWQAVLLIDDVDVYVAARLPNSSGTSLERETIVAVFLRALEYYRGILFLTTNSVLGIDEAITTRATLIIQLGLPSPAQRRDICSKIETRINEKLEFDFREGARDVVETIIEDKYKWNNREIINVHQIAIALAQQDEAAAAAEGSREPRPRVDIANKHMMSAVKIVKEFAEYQEEARGGETSAEAARRDSRY
ncbi:P-loop containing nucleoside triphosphate hydrolase protein [Apiospora saccharicola]|uniref:P-loop containing nucleoside triphosphate hydrolase protein n=1 Tax=Apiospora saccharicola TaxID=335842 RepID=A0ABR1UEC6_9PEZI